MEESVAACPKTNGPPDGRAFPIGMVNWENVSIPIATLYRRKNIIGPVMNRPRLRITLRNDNGVAKQWRAEGSGIAKSSRD